MITPQRALVRPRGISPESGENLPLDDLLLEVLERRDCRIIQIQGGPGAGKSTALAHLAARYLLGPPLEFLDDPLPDQIATSATSRRVVFASRQRLELANVCVSLAPWTNDDLLEYVLAVGAEQCAGVLEKIRTDPDSPKLRGNPALWHAVLDAFFTEQPAATVRSAVERAIETMLPDRKSRRIAGEFCLAILMKNQEESQRTLAAIAKHESDFERYRLLRLGFVQQILAGECVVRSVMSDSERFGLWQEFPEPLIEELARQATIETSFRQRLQSLFEDGSRVVKPQAATILFAADPKWRPPDGGPTNLTGGSFAGAQWQGVRLPVTALGASSLSKANFNGADLRQAILDGANCRGAHLAGSRLDEASLVGLQAYHADFSGAILHGAIADRANFQKGNLQRAVLDGASLIGVNLIDADLGCASLRGASLRWSMLRGCNIAGADFRGADLGSCNLQGLVFRETEIAEARFRKADLSRCDLEGVQLENANFQSAKLKNAWLTGSVMPGADFRKADLRGAGLAEIHWENADLRGANLRGCTFHMGSTRSGLVGSPYPGHGSKTGFYTDDYYDQGHKRPEEIRKANLRGADLRGANITDVDFYLVDLRGALYDDVALAHLTRCGAILADRCA